MSQLIEMLNKAYEIENKSFRGYMFTAVSTTGPLHDLYEKVYKDFAEKEKEHIYEVGEKITALGGKVSTACLPITEIEEALSGGYDVVLDALQKYEDESLKMYKAIHEYAESIDDLPTVLLLEHIIQEEQEHRDELERILLDAPKEVEEAHDELVVDAFDVRAKKIAELFTDAGFSITPTSIQIERLVGQLKIVNRMIGEIEDEAEWKDADVELNPGYQALNRERFRLKRELDDLDESWATDYFSVERMEEQDEVESVPTMKGYK